MSERGRAITHHESRLKIWLLVNIMDDSFDRPGLVSGIIIKNEKKSEMFYVSLFCFSLCKWHFEKCSLSTIQYPLYFTHKQYHWPGKIIIKSFSWHWKIIMPIQRKYDDYYTRAGYWVRVRWYHVIYCLTLTDDLTYLIHLIATSYDTALISANENSLEYWKHCIAAWGKLIATKYLGVLKYLT